MVDEVSEDAAWESLMLENEKIGKKFSVIKRNGLLGEKFSRLIPIRLLEEKVNSRSGYECRCECGNLTKVSISDLLNGHTKSCGCLDREKFLERSTIFTNEGRLNHKKRAETNIKNRSKKVEFIKTQVGRTVGRLVLVGYAGVGDKKGHLIHCKCSCGKEVVLLFSDFMRGKPKSCGCFKKEAIKNLKDKGRAFGKGYSFNKSNEKWVAYLPGSDNDGEQVWLGTFETEQEAFEAVLKARGFIKKDVAS